MTSGKGLFNLSFSLAFLGLVIGVACLVVAMAVVSGYEATLRQAVIDVTGDILFMKKGYKGKWQDLFKESQKVSNDVVAATPFMYLEGLLVKKGQLTAIVVQGVDPKSVQSVLRLEKKIQEGSFDLTSHKKNVSPALVGKAIAKKFKLSIGDTFKVVFPMTDVLNPSQFKKKIMTFELKGILNLGKQDYDERYIMTHLESVQEVTQLPRGFTGLYLKLKDSRKALDVAFRMREKLGYPYYIRDWREVNRNVFQAYEMEKPIIFFVFFIIIIAAAFNIASTLFVSVIQKYSDIALLKAMGLSSNQIMKIFSFQGLFIGLWGAIWGVLLGFLFCVVFWWLQVQFNLVSSEVYDIDFINVDIRFLDLLVIVGVTLFVCFLSALAPARNGSKLPIVEGLKYE